MMAKIHSTVVGTLITAFIFACMVCISSATNAAGANADSWESDSMQIRLDTVVSTRYGKFLVMASTANWKLFCKTADTSAAGFANDSINFIVGYRNAVFTNNTLGAIDTFFGAATPIDTITLAKLDTTAVYGWGVHATAFSPTMCRFLQPYVTTVAGQKKGKPQRVILELQRHVGTIVKGR